MVQEVNVALSVTANPHAQREVRDLGEVCDDDETCESVCVCVTMMMTTMRMSGVSYGVCVMIMRDPSDARNDDYFDSKWMASV